MTHSDPKEDEQNIESEESQNTSTFPEQKEYEDMIAVKKEFIDKDFEHQEKYSGRNCASLCLPSLEELDYKLNEYDLNRKNLFNCLLCTAQFNKKLFLTEHIEQVHDGKKIKCVVCDIAFTNKTNLNTHIASVHEKKKPFECTDCQIKFTAKASLKQHIDRIHLKKKPGIQCSLCDYCCFKVW